jgi:Mg2+ and Co2+ transporter CorA
MDIIEQYLLRSQEIIGDRTREEKRYDKEVIRWLRKGKNIRQAITKANKKYPKEALQVDESNINDVAAHYEYILEHEDIIQKISHKL